MTARRTVRVSRAAGPASTGTFPCRMAAKTRVGLGCAILSLAALPLVAQVSNTLVTSLPGHVPIVLQNATLRPRDPHAGTEQVTFTVYLKLADQAGFDAFNQSLNDANSPNYHHSMSAFEVTARFGPTQDGYNTVLAFLEQSGFTLVAGSQNRRTLTVRGTRAQAEAAFQINIDDYQLGSQTFHATAKDPSVPASLASLIGAVSGLSNLGQLHPLLTFPTPPTSATAGTMYDGTVTPSGSTNSGGLPPGIDGSGQVVGLLELDNYDATDLANTLAKEGLSGSASRITQYPINGGTGISGCPPSQNGCGTTEALLDIAAVLGIAPGATVQVFIAPQSTDLFTLTNAAINQVNSTTGGLGGIISASLGVCENEVSSTELGMMDDLLRNAAASGLTFFAATGDTAGTCTDSAGNQFPNTIAYPSDVPRAVAVGGTSVLVNKSSNTYGSEAWWTWPPLPAGAGFGISTVADFTPPPSYQSTLYPGAKGRSVPDVVAEAEPGIFVCQAIPTNPTNCGVVGGTSLSSPLWAGVWALVGQASSDSGSGAVQSASNGYLYKFSNAFHSAASMSSDFAHVGLGSPDIAAIVSMASPKGFVTTVNPGAGKGNGGSQVTVEGQGFIGVSKVSFGSADATDLTIYSNNKLTVGTPGAPSADPVEVKITTPAGILSSGSGTFSYFPYVTKISPSAGPFFGGDTVTVYGFALSDKYTFNFGNSAATQVACTSSGTSCTMVTPANAAGIVPIQVLAPVGNSLIADLYTYQNPSITSYFSTVGPTTGGLTITLNGTALKTGMTATFGGPSATATDVHCNSWAICFATIPAHAAGKVPLTVTVDGITSPAPSPDFTFEVFPTITNIKPSVVPFNTGTLAALVTVTITGTGFVTTGTAFSLSLVSGTNGLAGFSDVNCSSDSTTCTAVISVPPNVKTTATSAVSVAVGGVKSVDSVNFTYPSAPPVVPVCKGQVCN